MFFNELEKFDSEVFSACDDELKRQRHNIELIASENIVSKAVLLAAGGVLVGALAGHMNTLVGTAGFVIGVCCMVFSAVALGKRG